VAVSVPDVTQGVRAMRALGAIHAAMTGSGSAVFGVFESPVPADVKERWPYAGFMVGCVHRPCPYESSAFLCLRKGGHGMGLRMEDHEVRISLVVREVSLRRSPTSLWMGNSQVRGVKVIRGPDANLFPCLPGANPMAPPTRISAIP